jgi:hypothetical protein
MSLAGKVIVINVRMEALRAAIIERDWDAVEFQYDRVLRSVLKLREHE